MAELTKEELLEEAEAHKACPEGLRWLRNRSDFPGCLTSDNAMAWGYNAWIDNTLSSRWRPLVAIRDPERVERGLTHKDWQVREAYAFHPYFKPSPQQFDRGVRDSDWRVRQAWLGREDAELTQELIDFVLGLDNPWPVWTMFTRFDYEPDADTLGLIKRRFATDPSAKELMDGVAMLEKEVI